MSRPKLPKRIYFEPECNFFKPAGVPMRNLQENNLTREELESIRLIDYEEVEQTKASKKMNISQPTLSRLLKSARKKISDSLINGKSIKIQGGNFKMVMPNIRNEISRGQGRRLERGRRMQGFGAGPGGICICANCNYEEPQIRGQPCINKKCPKCGKPMTRK